MVTKKIESKNKDARVEKSGGDKFIWFLRKGGISRAPDFEVKFEDGKSEFIEFQYATRELSAYDFKVSKIAQKDRKLNKRVPKKDIKILFILKPSFEYALIDPSWIIENSKETVAPAWGNAPVYRVSQESFEGILIKDDDLKKTCDLIDKKVAILNFQHEVIEIEKHKMSKILQQIIDEKKF